MSDLIVLGAEGHSLIERLLLGSVSDHVATHAPCSVLVVRPGVEKDEADHTFKICIAHDNSDPANRALEELREFGWHSHTHIDLVSVMNTVYVDMNPPVYIDMEPVRKAIAENVQKAAATIGDVSPEVTTHVLEGNHTGFKLVDFATSTKADLIVLGNTGAGMLTQFLLGSVSRYVLRNASCSVWITRQKDQ